MSDDDNIYRVDARDLIGLRGRALRLKPARALAARSALAGAHRSRFRGRGMDYRESRHYQPGDDIRNMDWRVTARAGDAHVKVFDEERERPVVVLADFGPSMFFASRGVFKSVLAARLAALIGWSAVSRGDRIGALIFNGEHRELPPTGGRRGQMRLIRALVEAGSPEQGLHEAAPSAGLTHALTRLGRVARPGSLVFLLSDFYTMDSETAHHLTRLARHSDLSALQIVDPLELAPPPPGRYAIGNGRQTGVIDTGNRSERERYARHFERHHAAVRALTEGNGIALLQCRTDDDPAERLGAMLAARRPGGRGESGAPDTKRDDRGATGAAGATVRGAGMP